MKKFKFNLLAGLLFLISASVCAQNAPEKVQEAFKKMYPKVTTVESVSYTHLDVYKRQTLSNGTLRNSP